MMLRVMCVRYRIEICVKVFISLWISGLGFKIVDDCFIYYTPIFCCDYDGGFDFRPCIVNKGWSIACF